MEEERKNEVIEAKNSELSFGNFPPISNLPQSSYDPDKTMDENATQVAELRASKVAVDDEEFVNEIAEIKKRQIKSSAQTNQSIQSAKKEAERVSTITQIDRAFYEQWKAVLNFGGINEPTTRPFAVTMLVIIVPFYILMSIGITMPINIVRLLLSSINSMFEQIAKFSKIGRSIALSLLVIGTLSLIAVIIYSLVKKNELIS